MRRSQELPPRCPKPTHELLQLLTPALDDAHPMGSKHCGADAIRSAPPSNRRHFIASVDGEITRPGREGFSLPPLRADNPTCRDLWTDQAHAGNWWRS